MTDAKQALLAAAERLVAEQGVEGLSLRDVAKRAGQRNTSAVAYHFGGREGLVRTLLRQRMEVINVRRRELLAEFDARGKDGATLAQLVEAVLRPLVEHIEAAGVGSTYAQFMVRALPLLDEGEGVGVPATALHREIGARIGRQVITQNPAMAPEVVARRVGLALTMATSALAMFEQRAAKGRAGVGELDRLLEDLVAMTVAALAGP